MSRHEAWCVVAHTEGPCPGEANAIALKQRGLEIAAENERLRALYENVTQNRARFGWTINHLLECEESLRTAEARVAELESADR